MPETTYNSSEQKRRFWVMIGTLIVAVSVIFLVVLFLFSSDDTIPESSVRTYKSKAAGSETMVAGEGSEEYNKNLKEYDAKKTDEALQAGQSYIATPIANPRSLLAKTQSPPAKPASTPARRTAPAKKVSKPVNNELQKRTMEDLAALSNQFHSQRASGKIEYTFVEEQEDTQADQAAVKTPETRQSPPKMKSPLKSGDVLYAVVDTGINSDVPSTTMATVVAGKFKNYKLLGSFRRFDERLIVAFNRIITPEGEEYSIDSYAIDPGTTQASVASRVNTRFFERWGGLIAAAFLEGFGSAKRYSGAESYSYNVGGTYEDTFAWGDYSVEDQAWIAAGNVGQRAAGIMEKNFDRPPTVYLDAGAEIGILVVSGGK